MSVKNIISEPPYYHREYSHDLPIKKEEVAETWPHFAQRVVLVSLPFFALDPRLSLPISLISGSLRVYSCGSQLVLSLGDGKQIGYHALQTAIAVIALAGTVFAHPLGMLITTTHDILIELYRLIYNLSHGNNTEALLNCANIVNNSLYFALFVSGGLEIAAASLAMQVLIGIYHSRAEFKEGNRLEAAGLILMALIRTNQLNHQLNVVFASREDQKILNNLKIKEIPDGDEQEVFYYLLKYKGKETSAIYNAALSNDEQAVIKLLKYGGNEQTALTGAIAGKSTSLINYLKKYEENMAHRPELTLRSPVSTQSYVDWPNVGKNLNVAALYLKTPLHFVTKHIVRCFTVIHPGKIGNADYYHLEIAKRVGIFILAVGSGIIAFPLWTIGVGVDAIGDKLNKRQYTELQGTPQNKNGFSDSYKIYDLNFNAFWIPYAFGGMRPADERIPELAEKIKSSSPDIVVLQEMSFGNARALWNSGMYQDYEKAYTRIGPSPTNDFDTCLFIATKVPVIGEPTFIPLPGHNAFKRGIFYIETNRCFVMATHLSDDAAARRSQMEIVQSTIKDLEKNGKPVVLAMDANVDRNNKTEYDSLIKPFFHDPYTGSSTCDNRGERYMWDPKVQLNYESIDYVCMSEQAKKRGLNMDVIRDYTGDGVPKALSDHHALEATVDFTGRDKSAGSRY